MRTMTWSKPYKDCGAKGTRTPDLLVAKVAPGGGLVRCGDSPYIVCILIMVMML